MDQSRRNTLKTLGATGLAATVGTITTMTSALAAKATSSEAPLQTDQFSIHIEHTWGGMDANVVIKNTSTHRATITGISHSFIPSEPGLFDFSTVTGNGPKTLEPAEEIRIPFKPMGSPVSAIGHFDHSVQKRLRESLKIQTDKMELAKTTTSLNPRIV